MREQALGSREAGATTTSGIEEGFANIAAVQSLGGEGRQRERFARESWASFGAFRRFVLTLILLPGLFRRFGVEKPDERPS